MLLVALVSLLVTRLVAQAVVVVVVPLVALLVVLVVALSGFPYKDSVRKCLRAGALVVEPSTLLLIAFNVLKVPSASAPYLSHSVFQIININQSHPTLARLFCCL